MDWQEQSVILLIELVAGFVLGRVFIPYLRKIKTGKFDFYIGDRFAKDGSEPKFAGIVMLLTALIGLTAGLLYFENAQAGDLSANRSILIYAASFFVVIILTGIGLAQDYASQTKKSYGFKRRWIVAAELLVCVVFAVVAKQTGEVSSKILLPFHMGNVELGVLYYPLTAVFMTLIINLVQIHDCPAGVTEYSCDGLCAVTTMVFSLGVASAGAINESLGLSQLFAVCTTGVCGAYLFWGISPSKLYLGESGGIFLGTMVAVTTALSSMPIMFLLGGIVFVADGVATLLEYVVYRHSKKLLFKGTTLHGHFQNKGWGEYKIMGVSALLSLIGAAGVTAFAVYADKIML